MSMPSIQRSLAPLAGVLLLTISGFAAPATAAPPAAGRLSMIRVSRDAFPEHAEPSLAVNPRNPRNLLGAAQVFGAQRHDIGTFVSFDGGHSWRDNGPLSLPAEDDWADDVTVAFDGNGAGFVAAMATRQTATGLSQTDRGVYVWRTDDGGRTFQRPVAVEQGHFADHPWLAAGASPGSSGNVYVAWSAVLGSGYARSADVLAFSRSVDGGRHFSPPRAIAAPPGGVLVPMIAAGPGSQVAVVYIQASGTGDAPDATSGDATGSDTAGSPPTAGTRTPNGPITVVRSLDGGLHFGPSGAPAPSPDLGLSTGPSVAIDPHSRIVYVAYEDTQGAIAVVHSSAGSRPWSGPVVIADPLPYHPIAFQPQVVVDGLGGVDVTFFALARGRVDLMLARSTTHGTGFPLPFRLTLTAFNPALAPPAGGGKHGPWWIGDYQGLAAWGTTLFPFWTDTRTGQLEIFTAPVSVLFAR